MNVDIFYKSLSDFLRRFEMHENETLLSISAEIINILVERGVQVKGAVVFFGINGRWLPPRSIVGSLFLGAGPHPVLVNVPLSEFEARTIGPNRILHFHDPKNNRTVGDRRGIGVWRNSDPQEGLVPTAVALEVIFWFFVEEMIGRRYVYGYLVPSDYVSKDNKSKVAGQERLAALFLQKTSLSLLTPRMVTQSTVARNILVRNASSRLTLDEGLVPTAVALEVIFWFFVEEMIGRRYVYGYLVPSDYVSKDNKSKVAGQERLAALFLQKTSLSLLTPRMVTQSTVARNILVRNASSRLTLDHQQSMKIDGQQGFFKYQRDVSRDARYSNPAKPGDTATRFMFRKLGHAYEIYPLFGLLAIWCDLFRYTVYYSFGKTEIWLDRSHSTAPWDWETICNNYVKKPTLVFNPTGITHQRLKIMETLQDQMVAAAKERGAK